MTESALQSALHALIQQHVLCRRCRNPETSMVGLDDEHHTTILRCSACGTEAGSADKASPLSTNGCSFSSRTVQQEALGT